MIKTTKLTALFMALLIMTSVLTSCKKTPSDTESFRKTAVSSGYDVIDITDQYTKAAAIKTATVAAPKDRSFQIEFYILTDMENAQKLFTAQSDIIESQKSSGASSTVSNGRNYAKRTVISSRSYIMVEYIQNTIIYVPPTDPKNQEKVDKFLKAFNY